MKKFEEFVRALESASSREQQKWQEQMSRPSGFKTIDAVPLDVPQVRGGGGTELGHVTTADMYWHPFKIMVTAGGQMIVEKGQVHCYTGSGFKYDRVVPTLSGGELRISRESTVLPSVAAATGVVYLKFAGTEEVEGFKVSSIEVLLTGSPPSEGTTSRYVKIGALSYSSPTSYEVDQYIRSDFVVDWPTVGYGYYNNYYNNYYTGENYQYYNFNYYVGENYFFYYDFYYNFYYDFYYFFNYYTGENNFFYEITYVNQYFYYYECYTCDIP